MNNKTIIWPCQISLQMSAKDLLDFGPLVPAFLVRTSSNIEVKALQGNLILDTGADGMVIDEEVAEDLGLQVLSNSAGVHGIHGWQSSKKYLAKVGLPVVDSSGFKFDLGMPLECTGMPDLRKRLKEKGANVFGMIGRNFLQFCALSIDGMTGKVSIRIDEEILKPR